MRNSAYRYRLRRKGGKRRSRGDHRRATNLVHFIPLFIVTVLVNNKSLGWRFDAAELQLPRKQRTSFGLPPNLEHPRIDETSP